MVFKLRGLVLIAVKSVHVFLSICKTKIQRILTKFFIKPGPFSTSNMSLMDPHSQCFFNRSHIFLQSRSDFQFMPFNCALMRNCQFYQLPVVIHFGSGAIRTRNVIFLTVGSDSAHLFSDPDCLFKTGIWSSFNLGCLLVCPQEAAVARAQPAH